MLGSPYFFIAGRGSVPGIMPETNPCPVGNDTEKERDAACMIKLNNIVVRFGDFTALNNLSMHVPKGAVYGLVGPNGAGKSTAIRLLTGVYRPDCGEITLEDQPIYENPAVKTRISYIPDEIFFFPSASLEEMRKYYKGFYPNFDDELFNR